MASARGRVNISRHSIAKTARWRIDTTRKPMVLQTIGFKTLETRKKHRLRPPPEVCSGAKIAECKTWRNCSQNPILSHFQEARNSLEDKVLGLGYYWDIRDPVRRDIPDKNFMQVAFFCCFRQGVAGMSRVFGSEHPSIWKTLCKKTSWGYFFVP